MEKIWNVLTQKKETLSSLGDSNTVKPKKSNHLYLVYHFTLPLRDFLSSVP